MGATRAAHALTGAATLSPYRKLGTIAQIPCRRTFVKPWFTVVLVALALPVGAADLPPLTTPPTGEAYPGKLVWADLFTSDPPAARRFYTELFGWTATEVERGTGSRAHAYIVLSNEGRPVAGIATGPAGEQAGARGRWIGYVSVPDVAQALATAQSLGGRTVFPAKALPQRGTQALLAIPKERCSD